MNEALPLYNSRIIKTYQDFLKKYYPSVELDAVYASAGMTKYHVNDPGHWFSQEQVDRFYEALVSQTGNPSIAKEAGRYLTSSDAFGPVLQYMLALMNPRSMYLLMEKLYPMVSRGATVKAKKISRQAVEIISTPKNSVEKPYQCENRLGSFESVGKLFTNRLANIEHPECFHKGGTACRYIVSWEKTPTYFWKNVRRLFILIGTPANFSLFFFIPLELWSIFCLCSLIIVLGFTMYIGGLTRKELIKTVEKQGNAAEALFNEINIRHNNALLIQEIGHAASTILNIELLIKAVMDVMEKLSEFDRGLIMLSNGAKSRLVYAESYGYSPEQKQILQNAAFHLDRSESKGVFVLAHREQKPFLVDDFSKIEDTLSERSLKLAKMMEVKSLICVPIIYEKESLGILAVDNIKSNKPLTQSDISLLMGVASQTAVSFVNARSFQRLQESEKKYRDLVESANSIILRRDINGTIRFINEFAQNFFGYSVSEILGKNIVGTILPDAEEFRIEIENLAAAMQIHPEKRFISEDRHVLQSGEVVWVAWTHRPIFGPDGNIREILCIGNDTTELKQAEQEKKELETRLQRAQKMEAVGTLAGGVAHDLNNILSGIVSYPELILMGLPEDSPLQKPVRTIQKSGEKAAAIVQDLLTLARRGVVSKKVVNLNDIVSEYLKSPEFDYLKGNHPDVQVKTRLEKDLLNLRGSPVHLSKTLMNLVSNAAEAMPKGGMIHIITQNRYQDKSVKGFDEIREGDYVTLIVSDIGIGIPQQDIERIFEPFYTKKVMGRSGTGLGMAVVWGTVRDHDGFIDVQSTVGKGSKFTLYFPVTRDEIAKEEHHVSLMDLKGNGETILIVDDAEDQREIASGILERLGYKAASASSGEEALRYLRTHSVDLLVLDMIMDPGIDGYETYKRIVEINPNQKAIIASGFSETKRVRAAQKLGAGAYVKKPYLLEKIGKAVRNELNR
ncbi:MAG: hybrid sensor histidine kinase/response regulator [Desulfobacteraceae bacterium]|nr:MAG: hybrid sensor histidine kinase/response regulator [Desulfobacteraceae bacterium]